MVLVRCTEEPRGHSGLEGFVLRCTYDAYPSFHYLTGKLTGYHMYVSRQTWHVNRHHGIYNKRDAHLGYSNLRAFKQFFEVITMHPALVKYIALELGGADLHPALEACLYDSVCPAICINEHCDYVASELEPDAENCPCEVCGGSTVTSILVLAEIV